MASYRNETARPAHLAPPPIRISQLYGVNNLSVDSLCYESESPAPSIYGGYSGHGGVSSNASYLVPEPSTEAPGEGDREASIAHSKKHSRPQLILTIFSLCLSVLVAALDVTIVTTALPTIVASFGSEAGYTWIGSAFILAHTVTTPIWGAVSDIWGRKPIILMSVIIFFAGSLMCATVQKMDLFIAGRAIQGMGAAGMQISVYIVICDLFSLRDRGLYLALISLIWAVASALGPVLGGVFASHLDWRWCFWINLPISGAVFLVLLIFLKVKTPHTPVWEGLKAIDWSGSLFIVCGTLMVLLGLDFGGASYPWASPTVICLIVFGILAISFFILNEWKVAKNPIVPLRLFSSLSSVAAYSVRFCHAFIFMGIAYYLPLYSQSVLGADALTSGVYLLPFIVSLCFSAAGTGIFIQKTGKYLPLMRIGIIIMALGIGLFIDLSFEKDLAKFFIFQILGGIGVGMNSDGPVLSAQAEAATKDTSAISATMGFTRSISTVISIVLGGVVFRNEMDTKNNNLVQQLGVDVASKFNGKSATIHVNDIGSLPGTQQPIVRQAYFESLRTVWMMYVAFAGLAVILVFLIRPHQLSKQRGSIVLGVDVRKSVHDTTLLEIPMQNMEGTSSETLQQLLEREERLRNAVYPNS